MKCLLPLLSFSFNFTRQSLIMISWIHIVSLSVALFGVCFIYASSITFKFCNPSYKCTWRRRFIMYFLLLLYKCFMNEGTNFYLWFQKILELFIWINNEVCLWTFCLKILSLVIWILALSKQVIDILLKVVWSRSKWLNIYLLCQFK